MKNRKRFKAFLWTVQNTDNQWITSTEQQFNTFLKEHIEAKHLIEIDVEKSKITITIPEK